MKNWLKKLISGEKTTIVALGDSVTAGYFKSGTEFHSEKDHSAVYHQVLSEKLRSLIKNADLEVINAGVGGETSGRGLLRFDTDVAAKKPDLCIVCWGLNDINGTVEDYRENLAETFERIKALGADVVFMTPNMLNTRVSPNTAEVHLNYAAKTAEVQLSGKMDEFMDAAREVALEHGVPVCDCYKRWRAMHDMGIDTDALLANCINHPTREMHAFFAECLFETLLFG